MARGKTEVNNIINEYDNLVTEEREPFTLGDIGAILEIAKDKEPVDTTFYAIDNALKFAYVMGYNEALKQK